MTAIVTVYAVFADAAEARRIARQMVEERLAACANILGPCHSFYRWEGEVAEAGEVPAVFKTAADTAPTLIARIAALHSYELPAVIAWPVAAAAAGFAGWVVDAATPDQVT